MKLIYLISNLRRESKESFKKNPITEIELKLIDKCIFRLDGLKFRKASSDLFQENFANIQKLDLTMSSIENQLNPDMFQKLTLRKLYLRHNEITSLPDGIFNNCLCLDELDLSYNKINYLQVDCFKDLVFLKLLNLQHNQLTTLPSGIFSQLFHIEAIFLLNNHLKKVPNDLFENLPRLKEVCMHCDQIWTRQVGQYYDPMYTHVRIGENSKRNFIKLPGQMVNAFFDEDFNSLMHVHTRRSLST